MRDRGATGSGPSSRGSVGSAAGTVSGSSPRAIAAVRPLYGQLLAEERRHPNGRTAVEASSALLARLVADRAPSYEEFIWSVINEEES